MTGVTRERICYLWDVPRTKDKNHGDSGDPGVEVAFE